ncbi:glycosyltransferase family 2 protein [Mixta calida]|uniref:glycosyltransferase family 2 protein n=1 Tax=Mixta calida TaxID=665913 RepID=UPI00403ADBFE
MMNNNDCQVSIIMPAYNSLKTIEESINSVKKQTYTQWELLITDDCSTDGTYELLKKLAQNDPRIKIFQNNENSGAGVSRNNSIKNASGRFIAFLDSDDLWEPNKLQEQIKFMLTNGYELTYTGYRKFNRSGNIISTITPVSKVNFKTLLKSNVIGCLTAIYDTKKIGKIYMPSIRKRQDMALWLKILEKVDYAYCLEGNYALYRQSGESLSSNKYKILFSQWRFYRSYLNFGPLKSLYYFINYVYFALRKHGVSAVK